MAPFSLVLVTAIVILVLCVLVILLFLVKPNRNMTVWETNEYGSFEKCPHCGEVLGQDLRVHGRIAASSISNTTEIQVDGRELCPSCGKAITRPSGSKSP